MVHQQGFDKGADFDREMFEELFVLAQVSKEENFTGQQEEGCLGTRVFVLVEILINKFGDFEFAVGIVSDAVVGHVLDLIGFDVHVLESVL
jgi:hypothetical protein